MEKKESSYGYGKKLEVSFEEALNKIKDELKKEGFGILAEMDIKFTLKKKLGIDMDKYVILGACNPPNAHRALEIEIEVGLLLPCNVIVYEKDGSVFVSAIKPTVAMGVVSNEALHEVAVKIESKLKQAIDRL